MRTLLSIMWKLLKKHQQNRTEVLFYYSMRGYVGGPNPVFKWIEGTTWMQLKHDIIFFVKHCLTLCCHLPVETSWQFHWSISQGRQVRWAIRCPGQKRRFNSWEFTPHPRMLSWMVTVSSRSHPFLTWVAPYTRQAVLNFRKPGPHSGQKSWLIFWRGTWGQTNETNVVK